MDAMLQWRSVLYKILSHGLRSSTALLTVRRDYTRLLETRRLILCRSPQFSHDLLSSEDKVAHEALHHNHRYSINSALLTNEDNTRPKLRVAPEDDLPSGKKPCCASGYDVNPTGGSSSAKTWSSIPSRTSRAQQSLQCISSRRPTPKAKTLNQDWVVKHKVEEGKVVHKRAEQKRRNKRSF